MTMSIILRCSNIFVVVRCSCV